MSKAQPKTINAISAARLGEANSSNTGQPAWDAWRTVNDADGSISELYSAPADADSGNKSIIRGKSARSAGEFYYINHRYLTTFDTSIWKHFRPSEGTFSICLRRMGATNVDADHSLIAVLATKNAFSPSDGSITWSAATYDEIAGGISGDSWDSTVTKFTEPFRYSDLATGAANTTDIPITQAGLQAILENDYVGIWILDYTYLVLDQDPETAAPSAGADTSLPVRKGTAAWTLTVTEGGVYTKEDTTKRIDDDFKINTFSGASNQRVKYVRDGKYLDQVPYILGVQGPASLRGRLNDVDGAPLTTAGPPKVTGGSD